MYRKFKKKGKNIFHFLIYFFWISIPILFLRFKCNVPHIGFHTLHYWITDNEFVCLFCFVCEENWIRFEIAKKLKSTLVFRFFHFNIRPWIMNTMCVFISHGRYIYNRFVYHQNAWESWDFGKEKKRMKIAWLFSEKIRKKYKKNRVFFFFFVVKIYWFDFIRKFRYYVLFTNQ